MNINYLGLFLGVALVLAFTGNALSEDKGLGVMRPDPATLQKWNQAAENAPKAYIDKKLIAPRGAFNLLDDLYYIPEQRNQADCGNCWAWAGTGVMSVDLHRQTGILDRFSVQYNNACGMVYGGWGCCGGWLSDLADFYSDPVHDQALPWVNYNAAWQDGNRNCAAGASNVDCGDIWTSPEIRLPPLTT